MGNPWSVKPCSCLIFPDVFAAGDCAVVKDHSQPALAQVAYQQGTAIARSLLAMAKGSQPQPAEVMLRGTLMKMGVGDRAGRSVRSHDHRSSTGGLIRTGTYLELLPTPLRDFKATFQWIDEEIFNRYIHQIVNIKTANQSVCCRRAERQDRRKIRALAILAPLAFSGGYPGPSHSTGGTESLSGPQTTGDKPHPLVQRIDRDSFHVLASAQ